MDELILRDLEYSSETLWNEEIRKRCVEGEGSKAEMAWSRNKKR